MSKICSACGLKWAFDGGLCRGCKASLNAAADAAEVVELKGLGIGTARNSVMPCSVAPKPEPEQLVAEFAQPRLREAKANDHLSIGLTLEGLIEFCREIRFPIYGAEVDGYESAYKRDPYEMGWAMEAFGSTLTGYDFGVAIRTWIKANGKTFDSVCTILQSRRSPRVGRAKVFFSHIQKKPLARTIECMRKGLQAYHDELPADDEQVFFWLDYVVLKQCQSDFELPRIMSCIKEIGFTMVELDHQPQQYLTRSFCILETFATLDGGAKLRCYMNVLCADRIAEELAASPVDAESAQCWSPEDKLKIDGFIKGMPGGFKAFNDTITNTMKEAAVAVIKQSDGVETLDLSGAGLESADVAGLMVRLEDPSVTSLDISGSRLGPGDLETIGNALVSGKTSKIVALKCDAFQLPKGATSLDLSRKGMGSGATALLAGVVVHNTKLMEVNLDGFALPIKKLRGTESVISLDFSGKGLGAASAVVIASLISDNADLTEVNLDVQRKRGAQWTASGRTGQLTTAERDDGTARSAAEKKLEKAVNTYKLPYLYGMIKTHRLPFGWRFIAGGCDVALNIVSDWTHRCLAAISRDVDVLAREVLLGLSPSANDAVPCTSSFIVRDSRDVVARIRAFETRRRAQVARSKQGLGPMPKPTTEVTFGVYDFTTLYPTLPHHLIKQAIWALLCDVFALREERDADGASMYLGVASDMQPTKWSTQQLNSARQLHRPPDSGKFKWFTIHEIMKDVEFMLDHAYVTVGDEILKQVLGIPMGLSCSPMLANLMLAYYEIEQLKQMRLQCEQPMGSMIQTPAGPKTLTPALCEQHLDLAVRFSRSARAIDDVLLIDISVEEQTWLLEQTYPSALELKMVCQSPQRIVHLDMEICCDRAGFHTIMFDKRDELRLEGKMGAVRRFPHPASHLTVQCKYSCLTSFMHRGNRVIMRRAAFVRQVASRMVDMAEDGYKMRRLQFMMQKFIHTYITPIWAHKWLVARVRAAVLRLQVQHRATQEREAQQEMVQEVNTVGSALREPWKRRRRTGDHGASQVCYPRRLVPSVGC